MNVSGFALTHSGSMAKALTKSQIAASVAETVGLTKTQAVQAVEALVALAYKNTKNSFTLPGLGQAVGGEPQSPHGPKSGNWRGHQDPGQACGEVSCRQDSQGRHPGLEVALLESSSAWGGLTQVQGGWTGDRKMVGLPRHIIYVRIPAIGGTITRHLLVSFRADPGAVQPLLPQPFRPKLHGGYAVAGVCLIRPEKVRPAGWPSVIGISSENAALRIAVGWTENGTRKQGVSIPRRDTSAC